MVPALQSLSKNGVGIYIAKFSLNAQTFTVTFFEDQGRSSIVAAHVVFRVRKRQTYVKTWDHIEEDFGSFGTLTRIMHTLDRELQVPDCITHALHDLERNMVDSMISAKGSSHQRSRLTFLTTKHGRQVSCCGRKRSVS